MIRLGLRLTFGSGREALLRVLIVAASVALGVGLLLVSLAGVNGLNAQTQRGAWLDTTAQSTPATTNGVRADGLWWLLTVDQFGNQAIDRVDVAATGPNAPVPPGLTHLPGPGQYDVSPALQRLLASTPSDQLGDRFPGRAIGTIGAAGLSSPSSLIIVVGHTVGQLSQAQGASEVHGIQQTPASCFTCQSGVGSGPLLQWILVGAAIALLLPVLILIATASRLSATRREERFAAMRLVGATPRQISVIAAVEAAVAACAGIAVGFGLFVLFRPLLAHVPITGAPLAPSDLRLSQTDILLVAIGVPVGAVVSARLALRRVQVSPLGVSRKVRSAAPRFARVIPLLAGIGILAYFDGAGKPGSNGGQLLELLVGFLLIIVGLVLAGPWFTTAGSRLMALRARRPAALIAGRRLLDNPKVAFRFVSGLVLSLLISSAALGTLSSVTAASASPVGTTGQGSLADAFACYYNIPCPASGQVAALSNQQMHQLEVSAGARGLSLIHELPTSEPQYNRFGFVACSQLATTPAIGKCGPGAQVAAIGYFTSHILGHNAHASSTVWPTANISLAQLAHTPIDAVVVATNGSAAAVERARTALEKAFPFAGTPSAVESIDLSTARVLTMVQDMTDVIVVASLIIAACSLAVNTVAGLGERRRPFSLLRLTGVPTSLLRRIVTLESALPLLIVATISIVVGLVSAALYLHSQVGISFRVPGIGFWATVVGGLLASLGVIASTFPILTRITGPEVARNE